MQRAAAVSLSIALRARGPVDAHDRSTPRVDGASLTVGDLVPAADAWCVAGTARGRRLARRRARHPAHLDRVREAIFNALDQPRRVVDGRVLDLFAGSGALGIEALSRGAASCTFVEHDRAALPSSRPTSRARPGQRDTVVRADVIRG